MEYNQTLIVENQIVIMQSQLLQLKLDRNTYTGYKIMLGMIDDQIEKLEKRIKFSETHKSHYW